MRRREFIGGLLVGVAGALTCDDVFAAQKSPIARIGYLSILPPPTDCCVTPECKSVRSEACQSLCPLCSLVSDLRAFGWREGENLQIEARSSNGDVVSLPRLALELVSLRPDVLIALGSDETKALQAHTSDIPTNTVGKRLELLVDLLGHPPPKIAWLSNPEAVSAKPNLVALTQSAEKLGIEVERWDVLGPNDLEHFSTAGSEAVFVQWLALTMELRWQIAKLAVQHLLPTVYEVREYVVAGGLMSYGLDYRSRQSAARIARARASQANQRPAALHQRPGLSGLTRPEWASLSVR